MKQNDMVLPLNVQDVYLGRRMVRVCGKGNNRTGIASLTGQCVAQARNYLGVRKTTRGPLLLSFRRRRLSAQ